MAESEYACRLPAPQAPLVDPQTGLISRTWHMWALKMWTRTGGSSTEEADALANMADPGAPSAVTLEPSPFTYTAPSRGSLIVSGGGVIRLETSADGVTWYSAGSYYGACPLNKTARARLTYVGTPSLTFIPG
jgi:hypothetical protein